MLAKIFAEVIYMDYDITVIGAGVVDVLVGAVDKKILSRNSTPMDFVKVSFGGDALNEAVVLSRLGKRVQWISKVGDDTAGRRILSYAEENGLDVSGVKVQEGLETAVNVVLVDHSGERHFLTNPRSSLRRLTETDILPHLEEMAPIVSFASMFVSPLLDIPTMAQLFKRIKAGERTLIVDTTHAKNGETPDDLAGLWHYVDYFMPNEFELATLTGNDDTYANIAALMAIGVKCAVVKRGPKGCIVAHGDELTKIHAYSVEKVVDTTGAGDCFVAGFLWALSENIPLIECARFACSAASCSVEHVGATTGVQSLAQVMERYRDFRTDAV